MKKQHLFANFFIIFSIFILNFLQKSWTDHFCHFQRDENAFRVRFFFLAKPEIAFWVRFFPSPNPRMRSGFVFSFPVNPKLCFGFVFFDCLRIKTNPERNLEQIHATETNPERNLEQIHATETNPERNLERTHATETNPERIFINKKDRCISTGPRPLWEPSPKFTLFLFMFKSKPS